MESNGLFGWVENREERKETRENEMFSIVWLRIRQMGGAFFIRPTKILFLNWREKVDLEC